MFFFIGFMCKIGTEIQSVEFSGKARFVAKLQ